MKSIRALSSAAAVATALILAVALLGNADAYTSAVVPRASRRGGSGGLVAPQRRRARSFAPTGLRMEKGAEGSSSSSSSTTATTAAAACCEGGNDHDGRRAFLARTASLTLSALASAAPSFVVAPTSALAADELSDKLTDVYFGVGCFWHIQHEFVVAEKKLLGRSDKELTSRTGYAGGTKTDKEGRVCYHNFQSIADYGKLGHGEVVGMTIPESKIGDFAKEYFALFTAKGERVDPMDRGGEYRSLLGLPGGTSHPAYPLVQAAAQDKGMTLEAGKGNDPDTLGKKLVYVMDSDKFPFYQAEVYHQFHNDFQSPAYGKKYNDLINLALDDGRVQTTGCPDRV